MEIGDRRSAADGNGLPSVRQPRRVARGARQPDPGRSSILSGLPSQLCAYQRIVRPGVSNKADRQRSGGRVALPQIAERLDVLGLQKESLFPWLLERA